MRSKLYVSAIAAATLLSIATSSSQAQPYTKHELLKRGNDGWRPNCVVGAMNYYALLQQFPGWPSQSAAQQMRVRIEACKRMSVGSATTDAKVDSLTPTSVSGKVVAPPPPAMPRQPPIEAPAESGSQRIKACHAYAATALAQAQAQTDGQCSQRGPRWSPQYDLHFNWCTQVATPQQVQHENAERGRVLNACVYKW